MSLGGIALKSLGTCNDKELLAFSDFEMDPMRSSDGLGGTMPKSLNEQGVDGSGRRRGNDRTNGRRVLNVGIYCP